MPSDGNGDSLFAAVRNLNAPLTALHAAHPCSTALLLFSGNSDPRSMSAHAARRADSQICQNQQHGDQSSSGVSTGTGGSAGGLQDRGRALEEAVLRAGMGPLFVGVKTGDCYFALAMTLSILYTCLLKLESTTNCRHQPPGARVLTPRVRISKFVFSSHWGL